MSTITTVRMNALTSTPDFKATPSLPIANTLTITLEVTFPETVQATIPQLLSTSLQLIPESADVMTSTQDTSQDKALNTELVMEKVTDNNITASTPENESALKSSQTLEYIESSNGIASISQAQQALNFFQSQWFSNPYSNYSLVITKTSGTPASNSKQVAITSPNYVQIRLEIKNGQVVTVTAIDMEGVDTPDPELASLTIENLYKLAQAALDNPLQTVAIEYNHLRNIPSSIKIQQGNNEVVYQTVMILPDEEITVVSTQVVYKNTSTYEVPDLMIPSTYLPPSPTLAMPAGSTVTLQVTLPLPPALGNGANYPLPLSSNRYELLIQLLRTYIHMLQMVSESTQQHYVVRETHSTHKVHTL